MQNTRAATAVILILGFLPAGNLPAEAEQIPRPEASSERKSPPNIILIVADDLGWRDLGCYGSKFHETKHLDRLAAEGCRFTSAYAASSVCSPTRAAILTGKYPSRLNLTDWLPGRPDRPDQKLLRPQIAQHLPGGEPTIADLLRASGYRTASIGKWHLGTPAHHPTRHGFDINVAGTDRGSPPGYFSPYRISTLEDGPPEEYLTDRLTDEAVRWIERDREKPFFLYLPHFAVHNPLEAKSELVAKYRKKAADAPRFKKDLNRDVRQVQDHPIYAGVLESLDDSVGRIMDTLARLDLEDNTMVIFTSDNGGLSTAEGTPTSNLPLRMGKGWHYEGGVRVPLIVKLPGTTKPGSTCEAPVISTDFLPTLCELAQIEPRQQPDIDGVSMLPVLAGQSAAERTLFWHYPHYSNQGGGPGGAVRRGDHKLIEWFEDGRVELYDLKSDLGERNDLADTVPEKAAELKALLSDWRKSTAARMPTKNPGYDPEWKGERRAKRRAS